MRTTEILEPRDPRWSTALSLVPHDVYHLAEYVAQEARREGGRGIALWTHENLAHGFLPLVESPIPDSGNHIDALSPYGYPGPLFAMPENWDSHRRREFVVATLQQWLAILRTRGVVCCFLRLHPLLPVDLEALSSVGRVMHHGQTVSVDLRQGPAELWHGIRANHRNGINKAQRNGHEVVFDDAWDHLDTFIAAYVQTMSRVGAHRSYYLTRSYFADFRRALGPAAHLLLSRINGRIAAGALFTETNGIVQYHLGATFDEFLHLHPHKQLYHQAMLWARARGNRILHLGGGLGGNEDSLFHFKAGFSPSRHDFHTWRMVIDSSVYDRLVTVWESRSGRSCRPDGYFPPYRQPVGDLTGGHLQVDSSN